MDRTEVRKVIRVVGANPAVNEQLLKGGTNGTNR
jgi:hypothetical protein